MHHAFSKNINILINFNQCTQLLGPFTVLSIIEYYRQYVAFVKRIETNLQTIIAS